MSIEKIHRPDSASELIGVSRSTLYRLEKEDPTFPTKIRLSARCVGYRESALKAWLAAREDDE